MLRHHFPAIKQKFSNLSTIKAILSLKLDSISHLLIFIIFPRNTIKLLKFHLNANFVYHYIFLKIHFITYFSNPSCLI